MLGLNQSLRAQAPRNARAPMVNGPMFDKFGFYLTLHTARLRVDSNPSQLAQCQSPREIVCQSMLNDFPRSLHASELKVTAAVQSAGHTRVCLQLLGKRDDDLRWAECKVQICCCR